MPAEETEPTIPVEDHRDHVPEGPCDECAQANRRLMIASAVVGAAAALALIFAVTRGRD